MKQIYLFVAVALLGVSTVSCVENSGKYKNIVAQNSALQADKQALEAEYNETLSIINEIENGLAAIRENEGQLIIDVSNIEGKTPSKKEHIAAQMKQVQDIIAENKAKIGQLQKRVNQNGNLKQTIDRLNEQLKEKSEMLAVLESELKTKDVKIEELNVAVENLNTNLAELNTVSEQQKAAIKEYDTNINTAWYCIADEKALKEARIVSKSGLFAKQLMNGEFDKNAFTKIDKRNVSSIETTSKKVKILTSHPTDSYNLVAGEDDNVVIRIVSPEKFWSVSKYLVVKQ